MKFEYDEALERSEALRRLCDLWQPEEETETVLLNEAYGRVNAYNVESIASLPVIRSSKRDGIAVKSSDFAAGVPDSSNWVYGVNYAQADTGDDFPDEFDAVIAVEDIKKLPNGGIEFINDELKVSAGDGVNQSGSIVKKGTRVLKSHQKLSPEMVAACAISGIAQLEVVRKCKVAFIPTGSELIPWGSFPERGQNIESNSVLVTGLLNQFGAECLAYPVVKDKPELLEAALARALEAADIVIINGGSSRGEEDYNSHMLQCRASYFCHGVRAIPGRPVGMSIINGKPVVNVPGPALAAFLAIDWLIRGLVDHYYKIVPSKRVCVEAKTGVSISKPAKFERLTRIKLLPDECGDFVCVPISNGLSVPEQLVESDGMLVLPIGLSEINAGERVTVELLRPLELIEASWKRAE